MEPAGGDGRRRGIYNDRSGIDSAMRMSTDSTRYRYWGYAWLALVTAFAIHLADEAINDFLPLYNATVGKLRASHAFVPFPMFAFPVWLGALSIAVVALYALTPLAFAGNVGLRFIAYPLSVLMILNALGHMGASLYLGRSAPGVLSSPLLLLAASWLLSATAGAVIASGTGRASSKR